MKAGLVCLLLASLTCASELPVRRVILYKNGVGYFERAGAVKAGDPARLEFNASEMNDVLKSLTVTSGSGSPITGIHYEASDSLEKRLEAYPFRIGDRESLAGFLDAMKGERLELHAGSETVAGRIVSARINPPDAAGQPDKVVLRMSAEERQLVILLLDSGALRPVDLGSVSTIRFTRPELQRQLAAYLETLASSRSREKRTVVIDSGAQGSGELTASYTIPSPVWKSSYRLLLGQKQPQLEGWAIVDNTTGEEWSGIRLSLVSGRPVSFISRLYEPIYRQRQTAELPEEQPIGPAVHAGGLMTSRVSRKAAALAEAESAPAPAPPIAVADSQTSGMLSTVTVAATGREAGELFEYSFAAPVTIHRGESVMLPFLQQAVSARKLLIYTYGSGMTNPLSAAEIHNTTGKTLDGGPITVFDSATYAGEALMETLKKGDKRLISYGVDQGTRITTQFKSGTQTVRGFRLMRGVLTTRTAIQETVTYTIHNVDAGPKTIVIEHPARSGYSLLNQQAAEKTPTAYRFEVSLAPSATREFPVTEEHVIETSNMVSSITPDTLLVYSKNQNLNEAGRRVLAQIAAAKRASAAAQTSAAGVETRINEISRDQERLRQNILSLNSVAGQQEQVQKYAHTLAGQESQLATLRDQLEQFRKEKAARDAEVSRLIESAEF